MNDRANVGDWVEIGDTALEPGQRAPQVPEDTRRVSLQYRVRGFATEPGECGTPISIRTRAGRELRGTLLAVRPAYDHGFGVPADELLAIGEELRSILCTAVANE